jgi:hypothetical protein
LIRWVRRIDRPCLELVVPSITANTVRESSLPGKRDQNTSKAIFCKTLLIKYSSTYKPVFNMSPIAGFTRARPVFLQYLTIS